MLRYLGLTINRTILNLRHLQSRPPGAFDRRASRRVVETILEDGRRLAQALRLWEKRSRRYTTDELLALGRRTASLLTTMFG